MPYRLARRTRIATPRWSSLLSVRCVTAFGSAAPARCAAPSVSPSSSSSRSGPMRVRKRVMEERARGRAGWTWVSPQKRCTEGLSRKRAQAASYFASSALCRAISAGSACGSGRSSESPWRPTGRPRQRGGANHVFRGRAARSSAECSCDRTTRSAPHCRAGTSAVAPCGQAAPEMAQASAPNRPASPCRYHLSPCSAPRSRSFMTHATADR
jgi:hypothetical protein